MSFDATCWEFNDDNIKTKKNLFSKTKDKEIVQLQLDTLNNEESFHIIITKGNQKGSLKVRRLQKLVSLVVKFEPTYGGGRRTTFHICDYF